jgi:Tfp pilus assembly protein FimT
LILTLLCLVAVPRMNKRGRNDASLGLAREVYTRLVQARFAAISAGTRVQVTLVPGAVSAVQLRTSVSPGMAPSPPDPLGFGPVTDEVVAHKGAQIVAVADTVDTSSPPPGPGGGPTQLIFYPDGRARIDGQPTSQAGTTIYIADELLGYPHRIVVLAGTGFVREIDQ